MVEDDFSQTGSSGVTLIEVLITISMITILLGVAFWGYRDRSREFDLKRSALELATNLEKVREMAMSARIVSGGIERPMGGYGIRFEKDYQGYIIFLDNNTNQNYDAGEEIEELFFIEGISIKSITPTNVVDIIFIPPSPDVYINGSDTDSAEITIGNSSITKKITVNPVGLISIEN